MAVYGTASASASDGIAPGKPGYADSEFGNPALGSGSADLGTLKPGIIPPDGRVINGVQRVIVLNRNDSVDITGERGGACNPSLPLWRAAGSAPAQQTPED